MIRTVKDTDGKPFHLAASAENAYRLPEIERRLRRIAVARGCTMRAIPMLGQRAEGPYHSSFKVTVEDGIITRIVDTARGVDRGIYRGGPVN